MRRNVLIIGATSLLGTYLTAFRLRSSEDTIFHAVSKGGIPSPDETTALLLHTLQQVAPEKAPALEERVRRIPCDFGSGIPDAFPSDVRVDEAWLLAESTHSEQLGRFISALPQLGTTEFNYFVTGPIADIEREVIEQCSASGTRIASFARDWSSARICLCRLTKARVSSGCYRRCTILRMRLKNICRNISSTRRCASGLPMMRS